MMLLSDPTHIVRNPVSWEAFQRIQQQVDEQHSESLSSFNERALNWLVGGGAVGLAIFGAYHVFK